MGSDKTDILKAEAEVNKIEKGLEARAEIGDWSTSSPGSSPRRFSKWRIDGSFPFEIVSSGKKKRPLNA